MSRITKFADVILPLAIPKLYTYRVPLELNEQLKEGQRVVVQFGRSKLYAALVRRIHETAPAHYTAKYIESVLDPTPIVNQTQFALWEWISSYYLCTIGEVMIAALPSGLKLTSETRLVLNPAFDRDYSILDDKEFLIAEALEVRQVLSVKEVGDILDRKTVYPIIKSLIEKGAVLVEEELKERYKPRVVSYVRLNEEMEKEDKLKAVFDELERAPKQLELLMSFIQMSRVLSDNPMEVKKVLLQKSVGATSAMVSQLVKKEVFVIYDKTEGRLDLHETDVSSSKKLHAKQQTAYEEIKKCFKTKQVVLLHGVTSSGKTEIYVKLIEEVLEEGKQVLYLLPEIALTTQIISRLQKYFGNSIGVYHSRFNQHERVEIWNNVMNPQEDQYKIILGARSALFLPFSNLGLVIVDEEHENTFKQHEPAPRYHARDTAILLSQLQGAKTLLGSATPSIETYWNAKEGKYGLVELNERYGGVQLPEILIADIKEATRKKLMKSHFSPLLMEQMEKALAHKEQVILFQNRRGFSPFLQCGTCGWTPVCVRCDVSLTYHKYSNRLRCHYCGYNEKSPASCNACGDTNVRMIGFGTEKIEEELAIFFPKARIARMDWDTTRSKNAYQRIINDFEDREIDILVGTQMVTKGLDFDNVALVGILNAGNMLNFPDFRAFERSYQLMAQVAGRAGRKKKRGKVVIQAFDPEHRIIRDVIANDFISMYETEMKERKQFHYPPFHRLIKLTLKHKDFDLLNAAAGYFGTELKKVFGRRMLGPEFPPIARIRDLYLKNILLKIEREASVSKSKKLLEEVIISFKNHKDYKKVRIIADVDPV